VSTAYDIVVLGTGAAGLSAALTARTVGASVGLFEKAATVGGTTAVSGGVVWVPAHERPDVPEPPSIDDALTHLRALSNETMDDELVEVFARHSASTLEFLEAHSPVRFSVAEGFPDYKPELPGGRPQGGRSFNPAPFDFGELGDWADRVTAFPEDFSNVGFDAETRARMWGDLGLNADADIRVTGAALVGALLRGLLDLRVEPQTRSRAVELLGDGVTITGVALDTAEGRVEVGARRGVILATGGFEWDRDLVKAFLRGPMHGPVSPPYNTGDGLRMAMRAGAALGNMAHAWWVPVVKLPDDLYDGHERSRSVRLERTRPRSIMVNRYGRRFANEAADYNSLGGPFHHFDATSFEYPNMPAWIVFDGAHLDAYGFLGVKPGDPVPDWFHRSSDIAELARRIGIDPDGLSATLASWNAHVAEGRDPDFRRGASAYDGWWGDTSRPTLAERTLGPIDVPPFCAVQVDLGCMGTKGGPRTDANGQVLDVDGRPITGLYAAGNAMAGPTGMAYGGAGGTIGPALVWGHRAAAHASRAPVGATA
jgi:3-oxosteroid 1-dehydrogenase